MSQSKRPTRIEINDTGPIPTPDDAPELPEPEGRAMAGAISVMSRKSSFVARLLRWAISALIAFALSLWAWDFTVALLTRNQVLGGIAVGLIAVIGLGLLGVILREVFALRRMSRITHIRNLAADATANRDIRAARKVASFVMKSQRGQPAMAWHIARFQEAEMSVMDADTYLQLVETRLLEPLDEAAVSAVQASSRQVALVTAFIPLTLADLMVALAANLRMIRIVASIYGGHGGVIGNWRLTRRVMAHLVATGAMSVGEDLLEPVIGGGIVSKLSRRFGEGLVNGALSARVGVAAIEVCRPLAFNAKPRPPVRKIVRQALAGVFVKESKNEA